MSHRCAVLVVAAALSAPGLVLGDDQDAANQVLQIDPLLVAQAAEVWTLIGADDNPLWPQWRGKDSPILIYLPGQQDVLINHPSPPPGFVPYTGPVTFPVGRIFVRNGETRITLDGQNTSLEIEGHETLVVADTLSNLKNNLVSIIASPVPTAEKIENLEYTSLCSDPYATMGLIAHEAFHVFQRGAAPGKAGNELALTRYPTLEVTNNIGFALEGRLLAAALRASDRGEQRRLALQWLAAREWRRGHLTSDDIAYEDGTEFNEGLAKYIEYRLLEVLEGREPGPQMKWVRGFHGYADLSHERDQLIDMMARHMDGKVNVNNDPYGASPLRMRFYYSGMAVAALLDKLDSPWHAAILQPGTTLTSLARTAIAPPEGEIEKAIEAIPNGPDYEALCAEKSQLREAGMRWVRSELESIEHGAQTSLVIDYSRLENPDVAMSFTPFGIVAVDSDRTIFRLVPISGRLRADSRFEQTRPSPVLQDRKAKRFVFQLPERVSQAQLLEALKCTDLPEGPQTVAELVLPGVKLKLGLAEAQWQEDCITFTLCPG